MRVPDILLSGHHGEIARWRRRQRVLRTALRRPDLLETAELSDKERQFAAEAMREKQLELGSTVETDSASEPARQPD